jgi:hypothetical protein
MTEYRRRYRQRNREKIAAYNRAWQAKNKEKRAAHGAVEYALLCGALVRETCEICGECRTDGHHEDYSRPLDVRWLCKLHHRQVHAGKISLLRRPIEQDNARLFTALPIRNARAERQRRAEFARASAA